MKKNARNKLVCLALALALLLGCALGALPAGARSLAWENPFTDVEDTDWFYPHVQWAAGSGVLSGTSATTFEPDAPMTRGMFITALANWEGIDPAQYPGSRFQDVAEGAWYADAISWAAGEGIVSGYGDTFGPNDPITREQLAAILYRYAQYKGYDTTAKADLSRYTDAAQVGSYAVDAIRWANAEGLVNGTSATTLTPKGSATRAQVAVILTRFCQNVSK